MSCCRIIAGKASWQVCSPELPRARMERAAWRGWVRVILPRTVVPTSGRRGPVEEVTLAVGVLLAVLLEGVVVVRLPARLE